LRALITGFGGFAGGHLARHLLDLGGWQLWGTVHSPGLPAGPRDERVSVLYADLREPGQVHDALAEARPELVFHLAGQAFVPDAWIDPWSTFETNVRMQLNLLEAIRRGAAGARTVRVVAVTSMEVYGAVRPEDLPTSEDAPLLPANPYAASKAAQDLVAAQYARAGLDVVRVRPFNHIGPGQDPRFVAASFARQVAEIEAGLRPPLVRVGDLSAERDFTDVRDIVRGYRLAAEHGRTGEAYNLGRGTAHAVGEILDFFLARSSVAIEVVADPDRLRPADVPRTLADARRAEVELGWTPAIPLEASLADVLGDWRARVAARSAERI